MLDLTNKRCLCIVAHQDDESLYFGGLLSSCMFSELKITCITKPAADRPDTKTRVDSFKKVCSILNCGYSLFDIPDCGPNYSIFQSTYVLDSIFDIVISEIQSFKPSVIVTHSSYGEPNVVSPLGHAMHKLVNLATVATSFKDILVSGQGWSNDILFSYDVNKKKQLIDCYLPNWKPTDYFFVYDKEHYSWGEGLSGKT